jgi:hypothetical protein
MMRSVWVREFKKARATTTVSLCHCPVRDGFGGFDNPHGSPSSSKHSKAKQKPIVTEQVRRMPSNIVFSTLKIGNVWRATSYLVRRPTISYFFCFCPLRAWHATKISENLDSEPGNVPKNALIAIWFCLSVAHAGATP